MRGIVGGWPSDPIARWARVLAMTQRLGALIETMALVDEHPELAIRAIYQYDMLTVRLNAAINGEQARLVDAANAARGAVDEGESL